MATIKYLVSQAIILKKLKTIGNTVSYHRPVDGWNHSLCVLVFSHAGRKYENGQLRYVRGFIVDDMEICSIFHVLPWSSHRANVLFGRSVLRKSSPQQRLSMKGKCC